MAKKLTFSTTKILKIQIEVEVEVGDNENPTEEEIIERAQKVELSNEESELLTGATFSNPQAGLTVDGKCKVTFTAEKVLE